MSRLISHVRWIRLAASVFLLAGLTSYGFAEEMPALKPAAQTSLGTFPDGVKAYRKGDYQDALKIFSALHEIAPQDTRATYYLAITSAQLGRFSQARSLYEEILLLDPNGEAARLAQTGLRYLPADSAPLDLPPKFQGDALSQQQQQPANAAQPQAQTTGGMTPQDMVNWQMMMAAMSGGGGNNNQNGMNMLPMMMMPNASGGNGMSNIDPNVMSTMMMNQMMQNFDFSGNDKDN